MNTNGDGKQGGERNGSQMRWTYRSDPARGSNCRHAAARLADGSREHCCGAHETKEVALQPIEIDAGMAEGRW